MLRATAHLARMNHRLRERDRECKLSGGRAARPRLESLEERRLLSVLTVDTSIGTGTGSLPWAIAQASGSSGDTIEFDMTKVTSPITLSSPLDIAANVTIEGPGAGILAISGGGKSGVLYVGSGVTATINGLTITGGAGADGGINNGGGTLNLTSSAVVGNSGGTLGAGIDNSHGTATLTDCTIAGNFNAEFGGGIYNSGTLTVINSTIADNSSEYGAGIDNSDTVTLINSTLAGNTAQQAGGGINNGNSVTLTDTIIATNAVTATAGTGPDVAGSFTSDGYNLVGETDGSSGWIKSDKTGTVAQPLVPLLAKLGDYGGPTETMALLPGSPAIKAGTAVNGISADERGFALDSPPDIGAYQAVSVPLVVAMATDGAGAPSGKIDLRAAVNLANIQSGPATITFDPTVFSTALSITLTDGQLELENTGGTQTITGPAAGVTITGGGKSRVFQVDAGVTASLSGLAITQGSASAGGGLLNYGTVAVADCAVSGNSAVAGAGVDNAGGTITLNDVVFESDTAQGSLGGAAMGGGLYSTGGSVTVKGSTFTDDAALGAKGDGHTTLDNGLAGAAGQGGGLYCAGGTVSITDSTFSGDRAWGGAGSVGLDGTVHTTNLGIGTQGPGGIGGGGGAGQGGGLYCANGSVTLTNTMLTNNLALGGEGADGGSGSRGNGGSGGSGQGGGLWVDGGSSFVTFSDCTLSADTAQGGDGGDGGDDSDESSGGNGGDGGDGQGGGVWADVASGFVTFTNCTFSSDSADGGEGADGGQGYDGSSGGSGGDGQGGAVSADGSSSSTTFSSCTLLSDTGRGGDGGNGGSGAGTSGGTGGVGGIGQGGGVSAEGASGVLTFTRCTLASDTTQGGDGGDGGFSGERGGDGGGGGGSQGGGVAADGESGSVAFTNCTLASDTTQGGDGGDGDSVATNSGDYGGNGGKGGDGQGGGVGADGGSSSVAFTNCTLSGDITQGGDGGDGGSGSVYGYHGGNGGDGGDGQGGGVADVGGSCSVTITSCTVSGDTATGGDGGDGGPGGRQDSAPGLNGTSAFGLGGGVFNDSSVELAACTISGNSASAGGGGVYNFSSQAYAGGPVTLKDTIVAGNTVSGAGSAASDIAGANASAVTGSYNLIGTGGAGGVSNTSGGTGNLLDVANPGLAPLGDYGGPTETMALLSDSPAIGAGSLAYDPQTNLPITSDQRGFAIDPQVPDIGAFQSQTALVVNTTIDGIVTPYGDLSLRLAVDLADLLGTATTIEFESSVFASAQSITLSDGPLELSDVGGVTIIGPAPGVTVNAAGTSQALVVEPGVSASLADLTIAGGFTPEKRGGALYNAGDTSLTDCTLTGNSAGTGGALFNADKASLTLSDCTIGSSTARNGGGLYNAGAATLVNCTISGNSAGVDGGGVFNAGSATLVLANCILSGGSAQGGSGGGFYNAGTTAFTGCTISGNSTHLGGGGLYDVGTAMVADSTFSSNVASAGNGGGLLVRGAVKFSDCTISGNAAPDGSGGGLFNSGTLTLVSCTVSANSADVGGAGIYNVSPQTLPLGPVTLTDTIVAGNIGSSGAASDIGGPDAAAVTGWYSLIGTGGSGGLTAAGENLLNVADAYLSALGNYGGPTQTMALLPGSPALDAGTAGLGAPATDQRGMPRFGPTDIGAFESQGFTITAAPGSTPQSTTVGKPFPNPLTVTVAANFSLEPVAGGIVTLTAPTTGASATIQATPALINSNGQSSATATANKTAGSYDVIASLGGVEPSAVFALTNKATKTASSPTNSSTSTLGTAPISTAATNASNEESGAPPASAASNASPAQDVAQVMIVPRPVFKKKKMVSVGLLARVVPASAGASAPSGMLTFMIKKRRLGTVALRNGEATLTLKSTSELGKPITVVYSGDPEFSSATATSPKVTQSMIASLARPLAAAAKRPSVFHS